MGSYLSLSGSHIPKIFWATTPAYVPLKQRNGQDPAEKTSLRALLQSHCPSLFQKFRPAWWLSSGHLQTGYAVVGDFSKVDKVVYDRTLLELKDGGTLGLDFTPPASERVLDDETPIIVALHGLTGGSHESYVRAILAPAVTPVAEGGLGYRGVVMNFRGCAGVPLSSPQLYSAGHTDDVRQAIMYLTYKYPKAPILGVGFSLGANVLTRYIAEEGDACRLISGCALGCPWNLSKNGHLLHDHWLQRHVYSKGMGSNLKRLTSKHLKSIAKFPDSPLAQTIPELLSRNPILLVEFDSLVTRVAGGSSPPFPFPTADAYYVWASTHHILQDIHIPFLAINSEDDPIVQEVPTDAIGSKWVTIATTTGGGHLGWFEATGSFSGEVKRWVRKPVLEWMKATTEQITLDHIESKPLVVIDGWITEPGKEHLGCRVIGEGGRVEGVEGQESLLAGL
ncbi:AB-hydrolase YheT [Artomyces pyxidatus]|uniref:AB-hydrolase YheT n=1 Tax=Artomyces pyxidatus TaxID=48021 RepID=A0ACB8T962_9AGAM|nr:AB-hydrolase YheT [Artomyces pyxidatus]